MLLNELEVRLYLTRIGVEYSFNKCEVPTFERLLQLHQAHLLAVPFENLSIALNKKLSFGQNHAFDKVVGENRGGFCYELNYAFYQLLQSLHFDVSLMSAQVYDTKTKQYGKPFDHLMLKVVLDGKDYLADVGFGDSFIDPISIDNQVSVQANGQYQVIDEDGMKVLYQKKSHEPTKPMYKFNLNEHPLDAFADMFQYHQVSPESTFTQKSVCTLLTNYGRVTLANGMLIRSEYGEKLEVPIADEQQYRTLLNNEFNICLPDSVSLAHLLTVTT